MPSEVCRATRAIVNIRLWVADLIAFGCPAGTFNKLPSSARHPLGGGVTRAARRTQLPGLDNLGGRSNPPLIPRAFWGDTEKLPCLR